MFPSIFFCLCAQERAFLATHVFPELRQWCSAQQLHLVPVDLRQVPWLQCTSPFNICMYFAASPHSVCAQCSIRSAVYICVCIRSIYIYVLSVTSASILCVCVCVCVLTAWGLNVTSEDIYTVCAQCNNRSIVYQAISTLYVLIVTTGLACIRRYLHCMCSM